MTTDKLIVAIEGKTVCAPSDTEITAYYVGDFLSRVMGKAPSKCCWFTIMNNVNVAGVACLADVSVVVLCEGVTPDEALKNKCTQEGIGLITTDLSVFDAVKRI